MKTAKLQGWSLSVFSLICADRTWWPRPCLSNFDEFWNAKTEDRKSALRASRVFLCVDVWYVNQSKEVITLMSQHSNNFLITINWPMLMNIFRWWREVNIPGRPKRPKIRGETSQSVLIVNLSDGSPNSSLTYLGQLRKLKETSCFEKFSCNIEFRIIYLNLEFEFRIIY